MLKLCYVIVCFNINHLYLLLYNLIYIFENYVLNNKFNFVSFKKIKYSKNIK